MRRPIVLVSSPYYLPGFRAGGALRTVANLVDQIGQRVRFLVVTRDRDYTMTESYPGAPIERWHEMGNARVYYVYDRKLTLRRWREVLLATKYDVLYLNSLLSPVFTLRPLILRRLRLMPNKPVVLAPRGELARGALSIKASKKKWFLAVARLAGLYDGVRFQASSNQERSEIADKFPKAMVVVAQDLPASPVKTFHRPTKAKNCTLKLAFVSRIAPVKNLHFALSVLKQCDAAIEFDIYGPVDRVYWDECRGLIRELPPNVTVTYRGTVPNHQVSGIFGESHFLLLPTLGENFGHVIFEALSVGCPVIISDRTIWRNLSVRRLGWDLSLEDDWRAVIDQCSAMSNGEYQKMCASCFEFAKSYVESNSAIDQNVAMFFSAAWPEGSD